MIDKEQLTYAPDFWHDADRAERIMRDIRQLKGVLSNYATAQNALDDLEVLLDFYKADALSEDELAEQTTQTNAAIDDLELQTMLGEPEDNLSAVLEINSGAGGTDSCDWADMLYRMYVMWGEKNGYKVRQLNYLPDDIAGIRSATLEIDGNLAYGFLKGENGVHRLVRISPFNSQNKRQTSFASVYVYPLVDDTIEIDLNPADVTMENYRATGAGGQHINTTDSAVRLRHAPSGLVVTCQEERNQHLNRSKAMKMLRSQLFAVEVRKRNAEREKIENSKQKIEWGSQIRSYVLDKQYVVDMRSGHKSFKPQAILDGDINAFLKATLLNKNTSAIEELEL